MKSILKKFQIVLIITILTLLSISNEGSAHHSTGSIQLNGVKLKQLEPGITNPIIFEGTEQKFVVEVEADAGEKLESIRIYPSWVWSGDVLKDYPTKNCGGKQTCKRSVTARILPHTWGGPIGGEMHGISTWYADITTESGKKSKVTWQITVAEDKRVLGNGSFSLTPANDKEINLKVGETQTFRAHWTNSQVYIILFTAENAIATNRGDELLSGVPYGVSSKYASITQLGFAISEMDHSVELKWDKPGKYIVKVYAILSHIGPLNNLSIVDQSAENPEEWIVNVESENSDLIIESARAEPATVAPGEEFKLYGTLKNLGPGTSSATTVRYLRLKLGPIPQYVEIGKGERDSLPVNESIEKHFNVEAPTEPGTYEYRVCVDEVPKETDVNNNCSKTVIITVDPDRVPPSAPDLVVKSLSPDKTTVAAEQPLALSATVSSLWAEAPETTLTYYEYKASSYPNGRKQVGTAQISSLAKNATTSKSLTFNAPSEPGDYFYTACVSSVNGERDTTNNCVSRILITVTPKPKPDLIIESINVGAPTIHPGTEFRLIATVKNNGDGASPPTTLRLKFGASDQEIETAEVGALNASATQTHTFFLTPNTVGDYHYEICADGVDGESQLDNNCNGIIITVIPQPIRRIDIYWTSHFPASVWRGTLNGTVIQNAEILTGLLTNSNDLQNFRPSEGLVINNADNKMYWATNTDIRRKNLDGSGASEPILTNLKHPVGIALDPIAQKIYWTEFADGTIWRANVNGSSREKFVTGLESAHALALDKVNNYLYWTNPIANKIQRWNLDRSGSPEDVVGVGFNASVLTLDTFPDGVVIYWIEGGTGRAKIRRTHSPDLRHNAIDIVTGLNQPVGLALDVEADKIYWADVQGDTSKLQQATLNGGGIRDISATFGGVESYPIDPRSIALDLVLEQPGVPTEPASTSLADIALIIDSSGSMDNNDPDDLRKKGANLFIDSADPRVQIAIIDFDGDAVTFAPLTFADFTGKNILKSAVARVDASGGTDIDDGLQQGFQELNASTSNAKKAAVLLTDGQDSVEQQVLSNYAARGWPIYTIGLGSGVDRQVLERIAQATEGEYFQASLDNLQTVYNKILAKTTGKSILANYEGYINQDQQITKEVSIDDTVDQVDMSINWQGSTIELVLIDPDGTQITPQNVNATLGITYQAAETYAIWTIQSPKPGTWQLQATGTDIPAGGEPFNLTVSAVSDFSTNLLAFNSSYAVGDTIRIGIRVQEKIGDTFAAVLGATTTAKILRPDGKIETFDLYDDGSHNDGSANDGVYANTYRSVNKQGTYFIQVTAQNGFSREIQEQVVVGRIDNVLIDGSTLTPAAGATLKQTPNVISAVISGPAGRINSNSIVLKVDGSTVSHSYDAVNQRVSYQPSGLSGGSHSVQLSLEDTSGNAIETTWEFTTKVVDDTTAKDIAYIYWTDDWTNRIQRANLDGTNVEILVTGLDWPSGIALDIAGGKMYWTDLRGTNKIQRSNLDGTQVENLVTNADGVGAPRDIALDVAGGKMYWTDGVTDKIQRSNLDGTQVEDLVHIHSPSGIALDVAGGKMYWTGWIGGCIIQRSNLDGTQVENLVTGLDNALDIALDVAGGKMYWTDQGNGKIQRSNLDGTQVEDLVIVTGLRKPIGIALDVAGGKMYWAEYKNFDIQRANLDGTQVENHVTESIGPFRIALGISSQPPPATVPEDANGTSVLFSDNFSSGNLDKWTPQARIGNQVLGPNCQAMPWACNLEIENGALKLVATAGGNYSVEVIKDIFPTDNYTKYVLSFDWKSTVKETPYGISYVSAYFYDRTGKRIGIMVALNTGFPNRTFEDHGRNLVPGRYGGVFKSHESFNWEKVTLDTTIAVPRLNMADVYRIQLRAEVYNDAGSGGDLYVDNLSFVGVSGTSQVVREDVNGDGVVDLQDTTVLRENLGQTGENAADVNDDGVVDVNDLVLVLAAIEAAGAAPPIVQSQVQELFTAEEVQQWLAQARLSGNTSPAYLRGIAVLEQILALLTPQETMLLANYPNPFNPETWIPYRLAHPAEVTLTIYAVNGQVVRMLDLGYQVAGFYEGRSRAAHWDGRNAQGEAVASGVYFYTLKAGEFAATRKMLIRK